jgi:hypothetical protein
MILNLALRDERLKDTNLKFSLNFINIFFIVIFWYIEYYMRAVHFGHMCIIFISTQVYVNENVILIKVEEISNRFYWITSLTIDVSQTHFPIDKSEDNTSVCLIIKLYHREYFLN